MSRSERLLTLLQLLRGHRYAITGAELASQLGISLRTLYRDIATLQAQGAHIEGEPGIGYVLRPGFMLVIVYETMMAVRHFDLFFILTEGGPAEASHVLAWQVYVETFRKLSFGTGSALAYVMALVTFLLAWSVIRTLGRKL